MGESEKNTIRQVGKECDLSAFNLSKEQQEVFEILRTVPQELIGIIPCEIRGQIVSCLTVVIPNEEGKGEMNPLAILVDDNVFKLLTPLYDSREKFNLEDEREDEDNF